VIHDIKPSQLELCITRPSKYFVAATREISRVPFSARSCASHSEPRRAPPTHREVVEGCAHRFCCPVNSAESLRGRAVTHARPSQHRAERSLRRSHLRRLHGPVRGLALAASLPLGRAVVCAAGAYVCSSRVSRCLYKSALDRRKYDGFNVSYTLCTRQGAAMRRFHAGRLRRTLPQPTRRPPRWGAGRPWYATIVDTLTRGRVCCMLPALLCCRFRADSVEPAANRWGVDDWGEGTARGLRHQPRPQRLRESQPAPASAACWMAPGSLDDAVCDCAYAHMFRYVSRLATAWPRTLPSAPSSRRTRTTTPRRRRSGPPVSNASNLQLLVIGRHSLTDRL
jgi:hypothetical protein